MEEWSGEFVNSSISELVAEYYIWLLIHSGEARQPDYKILEKFVDEPKLHLFEHSNTNHQKKQSELKSHTYEQRILRSRNGCS